MGPGSGADVVLHPEYRWRRAAYPLTVGMSSGESDSAREDPLIESLDESEPEEDEAGVFRSRAYWERRAEGTRASLEARRSSSRFIDTSFYAYESNRRVPASLLAGALAARLVVYVIPFMVLAVVATGLYSDASNTDPVDAAREAGMAGLLAEAVEDSAEASRGFKAVTLVTMALVTIWTADSLAKLVRRVHALVWATPMQRPRRRWMLPLAVLGLSAAGLIGSRTGMDAEGWSAAIRTGELLLEFALLSGAWLLVSSRLPHDPAARSWRNLIPGALLVAAGVIGMKAAMVLYFAPKAVTLVQRYDEVATAIVLITWGYWVAFILVFAAELNAALFRSQQRRERAA